MYNYNDIINNSLGKKCLTKYIIYDILLFNFYCMNIAITLYLASLNHILLGSKSYWVYNIYAIILNIIDAIDSALTIFIFYVIGIQIN